MYAIERARADREKLQQRAEQLEYALNEQVTQWLRLMMLCTKVADEFQAMGEALGGHSRVKAAIDMMIDHINARDTDANVQQPGAA